MKLNLQTFSTVVANSAAAVQAATTQLLDLSTGSVLRAVLEANASMMLWMQWLIIRVLRATRASTSSDDDLDSWMADFEFSRLPPARAVGEVTLSRFSTDIAAVVAPTTLLKTGDGSQTFGVSTDTLSIFWDPASGTYLVPIGTTSVEVPVIAQVAGSAGNVQAATITLISSPLAGIDTVTNALGTTGGCDAEPDAPYRQRFHAFINSRSRATLAAVECAIITVQQGLSYSIHENVDSSGASRLGSFVITVDDGSGIPSDTVLAAVNAAVHAVRPIGSVFTVRAPTVCMVSISACIITSIDADHSTVLSDIRQSITNFVNTLAIGQMLPVTRIAQLAYDANPAVLNVSRLLLNGETEDVLVDNMGVIKISSLLVT